MDQRPSRVAHEYNRDNNSFSLVCFSGSDNSNNIEINLKVLLKVLQLGILKGSRPVM
jgi:hypothetical protein